MSTNITDVNTSTSFSTNGTFTIAIQPGAGVHWACKKLAVTIYPTATTGVAGFFDVTFGGSNAPLAAVSFPSATAMNLPAGSLGAMGFFGAPISGTTGTYQAILNPNAADGLILTNTHYLNIRCTSNPGSVAHTCVWAFSGIIVP